MEVKVESRVGRLQSNDDLIFGLFSDCTTFQKFELADKVKNWYADRDSFRFTVDTAGDVTFRIVERHPNDLIKFSIENAHAENIFLWLQLKAVGTGDTRIKLTAKLETNPMMNMIISKPLKQGLDRIVETLENVCR